MNKEDKERINIMIYLSGLLIPISLASITLIGVETLTGTAKNILMFSIPVQIILLIISVFIGFSMYGRVNKKEIEIFSTICNWIFFIALILISVNHFIVLFSS